MSKGLAEVGDNGEDEKEKHDEEHKEIHVDNCHAVPAYKSSGLPLAAASPTETEKTRQKRARSGGKVRQVGI